MSRPGKHLYAFESFRLDPQERLLLRNGQPVPLPPRVFDTLLLLVQNSGHLVLKDDLMKTLWPDSFVEEVNLSQNVSMLRKVLGEKAHEQRYITTVPGSGYRFAANVRELVENGKEQNELAVSSYARSGVLIEEEREEAASQASVRPYWNKPLAIVGLLAIVIGGIIFAVLHRPTSRFMGRDPIVLADFTNSTGDPVFDGALGQGLAVQLEQSPFVSLVSEQRIQQALRLMGKPDDTKLTPELARELCQRTQSAAVLDGTIVQIGTQYSLILKASSCSSGESLASAQVQADDKNHVLEALGRAASLLRRKLGESISSVKRYDAPLEQATTPSLEALKAFSLGAKTMGAMSDFAGAAPFLQRAIRLDPNFAMAYEALGTDYSALGETTLATENTQKAYALRQRVSEREKLFIEAHYYLIVTGNLEKARQAFELAAQTFPREVGPLGNLAVIYEILGQYDQALAEEHKALNLDPTSALVHASLVQGYLALDRLSEAQASADEAEAENLDSPPLRDLLYLLAFLLNDSERMAKQLAWSAGKPGVEDVLLAREADTAAYSGRLRKARDSSRRAVASAERAEEKETAADYEADAALREALFGNATAARRGATVALGLSSTRDVQYGAGLALAFAGEASRAQSLAADLAKSFPEDTTVQFKYLPTLHAQFAFSHGDAAKAIEVLEAAAPYELGLSDSVDNFALYSVYVRGEAYLGEGKYREATAEFQRILDHRGIVQNEPIGALARLGLAHGYALEGDSEKARTAYQDFLRLWKDADPDIPVLKQAKAEYAKLQ